MESWTFALVTGTGTKVFEVEGLPDAVYYLPVQDVAVVRAGLTQSAASGAADWVLVQIAARAHL